MRATHRATFLPVALLILSAALSASAQAPAVPAPAPVPAATAPAAAVPAVQVVLSQPAGSGIFNVGETIQWTVTATDPAAIAVPYTLMRNGLTEYKTGTLPLAAGIGVIETSLDRPGTVLLRIGGPGRGAVFAGALVSPAQIQPSSPRPPDFDAWWESKIAWLHQTPVNAVVTPKDISRPDIDYALVTLDNVNGAHVQGQIAKPAREGRFPALVILQWAGVYGLPASRAVDRAAEGWLTFNVEPHDMPPDRPADFYTELSRTTLRSYQAIGQQDRETSYFLQMYLGAYRALDYITSRPDWDGRTLVVQGTSMGGQQAVSMAGLHPRVSALVVMVPSGMDVTGLAHDHAIGFPDWGNDARTKNDPRILETAQYFDPMNFASRVTVPALVAMGLYDTTSPPVGVWAAINQMKGPVEPLPMVSGHQDVANSQRLYKSRSVEWLNLVRVGQVPTSVVAPPAARGCVAATSAGDHTFTCGGLKVDARVPAVCTRPGCGLILEVHGDTGTGLLEDAHTKLRELGERAGYIVVAPTGPAFGAGAPGSTWSPANDATLVDIVKQFTEVFRVDRNKVHVTGFSRGGYTTWRLLCDHADLFASAAPAAAGATGAGPCFAPGRAPSRKMPILFLMGRTDANVPYAATSKIRDAAIAAYGATGPRVIASDARYTHNRWTSPDGVVIDVFEHGYENAPGGSWASAKGHCIPGSTVDPAAPQYGLPCQGPTAFNWGEEVMRFFQAHPRVEPR